MVHANRTENIETGSSGHLQVENDGIRICFLYAANGFRNIARLPYKLRSRYFLQQVRQTFHDRTRIIGDKDSHLDAPRERTSLLGIENDRTMRKYIGLKPQSLVRQNELRVTVCVPLNGVWVQRRRKRSVLWPSSWDSAQR